MHINRMHITHSLAAKISLSCEYIDERVVASWARVFKMSDGYITRISAVLGVVVTMMM